MALLYSIHPSLLETYSKKRFAVDLFFEALFNTYCHVAIFVVKLFILGSLDTCISSLPYFPEL